MGLQRDILNFTDCTLPNKIKKILSKGPSGGSPRMTSLMVAFERLIKHWSEYAKSIKVDPFRLWTYKTKLSGFVEKFSKCWEKNDFKQVRTFFDQNPNLKCVKVDKTSAYYSLRPIQSLKRAYGLLKVHKPDRPLRPIVSSLNSLTSGAENFLMKILSKFKTEFKFSLENSESFRNFVPENKENFDHCVSFVIVSMYPNVNLSKN